MKLLYFDHKKAAAATAAMKEIKNDPKLLSNLMQLAMSDPESSVRQMAAVILRKDLSRKYTQERVTFL